MRKNCKNVSICIVTTIIMFAIVIMYTNDSSANTASDLNNDINENQSSLDELESSIADMQNKKDNLNDYMDELRGELNDVNNELASINTLIDTKTKEIEKTSKLYDEQADKQEEQYLNMKKRIQYIYEMEESSYLEILMSAASLSDFLNKTEYVQKLMDYDRDMLEEFKTQTKKTKELSIELEEQKTSLETLKAQAQAKQNSMMVTIADSATQINAYEDEIDDAEIKMLEIEAQIDKKRRELEALDDGISDGADAGFYTVDQDYVVQEGDLDKLAAIIYCEAGGETYEGKIAVGSVVMNRVMSWKYDNNITGVLMQPYQFSPVLSGRFAEILAVGANEDCYKAARDVLYDGLRLGPWLYFRVDDGSVTGTVVDHQVFYGNVYTQ